MRKSTILIVVILLVALGLFVFVRKSEAPVQKPNGAGYEITESGEADVLEEQMSRPWIEVLSSNVYVKTAGSWEAVNTGDEFENGSIIKTDETGLAEIHMPDGSAVRLDSDSEIILSQGDYDEENNTLRVRIVLSAGRVWSKIIELSTPDSFWEVESANAVASVRGTSFGMEYINEETQIVGSENTVEVETLDPATKQRLGGVVIAANKMIKINRQMVESVRDKRMTLSNEVKDVPDELKSRLWVSRSVLADQVIKRRIEALKARGMSLEEIRKIIQAELLDKRRQLILRLKNQGMLPRLFAPPTGTAIIAPVQMATTSVELLNVNAR